MNAEPIRDITLGSKLILSGRAAAEGRASSIRTGLKKKELARVRRGAYIILNDFTGLGRDDRYRIRVLAAMASRRSPIAAGPSAAALLGLPTIGGWPSAVYLLSPTSNSRKRNGVIEIGRRAGASIVERDGMLLTSTADIVWDCCRVLSFTAALAITDAAIHTERFSHERPLTTLDEVTALHKLRLPYHGSARVAQVLAFADPLSEKPLETFSRSLFRDMGFPAPVTQYRVWLPRSGREAFLDFGWPDYGTWGEADGVGKYLGDDPSSTVKPVDRVLQEKRRENEIRVALKWSCARWEWDDAWKRAPLRRILLEAGLPIVRRPTIIV